MRFNQDKAVIARSLRELTCSQEVLALNRTNKVDLLLTVLPPALVIGGMGPLEIGTRGSQTLHCAMADQQPEKVNKPTYPG